LVYSDDGKPSSGPAAYVLPLRSPEVEAGARSGHTESPTVGSSTVSEFAIRAGSVLREARRSRGLTLHAVADLSGGSLRPSTVAGYEHGARAISLERFTQLCALYGVPADRLIRDVMAALELGQPGVIDLAKYEVVSTTSGVAPEGEE
jgi:transcriptional regulator with XRE-family HTH domain